MALKLMRPASPPEKRTRTTVDTVQLTPALIQGWQLPPSQRPFKLNPKVRAVVEQIKADGGVVPGILTLGVLDGTVYIVDGQHRIKAFEMTGLEVGYADVRQCYFSSFEELAGEFERLNTSLVALRTDDRLRATTAASRCCSRGATWRPAAGSRSTRRRRGRPSEPRPGRAG